MRVLLLRRDGDQKIWPEISLIIQKLRIPCDCALLGDGWQDSAAFLGQLEAATHVIVCLASADVLLPQLAHLAGIYRVKPAALVLYPCGTLASLPLLLEPYPLITELGALGAFLKNERKASTKMAKIERAKRDLKAMNLHFAVFHFFLCVKENKIEAVELFLRAQMSADMCNEKGVGALCLAARLNHNEIARLLLENNCDPAQIAEDNGNNALMDAAAYNNLDLVAILLGKHIDINVKSKNEQTALMLAVGRGNVEIVKLLIEAGADTESRDVLGMTALKYAEILKYHEIQKLLQPGGV